MTRRIPFIFQVLLAAVLLFTPRARAADSLVWHTNQSRVDADITDWNLPKLLRKISSVSGWHVYLEPGTSSTVTAKFKDLPTDEALTHLLSGVSYAVNATNGVRQLFVFRTAAGAATVLVEAPKEPPTKDYRILNELIVRLKRNSTKSIEEVAKAVGAKILGRDDRLKIYRLQFADEAAANAASALLSADDSVAGIYANYVVDPPAPNQSNPMGGINGPPSLLNPKTPVDGTIVGLIDTAVQMQDQFLPYSLTPLSVVGQPDTSDTEITHGTSMFETLLEGMSDAPSKILPVDVYASGESTSTFEVAQGIYTAVNAGANPINLSLGGTGNSDFLASLIAQAVQKGVLFVAASGNVPGTGITYPAAYPGVLAVTASDPNGQLASYANDGPFVRAMEPGSTIVYLNGQAWTIEGTSASTALATAAIAQIVNEQHIPIAQAVNQFIQSHPPPKQ